MLQLSNLPLPITHSPQDLQARIRKTLRLPSDAPLTYQIRRQSLDCRDKRRKLFVYTLWVDTPLERKILKNGIKTARNYQIQPIRPQPYTFPFPQNPATIPRPVIIGAGPAGLFSAWYLARAGLGPLLLERGEPAPLRRKKVTAFWQGYGLDPESNVQFGEGGAGTFSDGKLNTLVKDPLGRNREVLERLVSAGAPKEILYQQKPHLGTDRLMQIVTTLRQEIIQMGGEVRFGTKLTGLNISGNSLQGIYLDGREFLPAKTLVLAIGHSARDTFEMLHRQGVPMEAKAFAVGLRAQHPQSLINLALYGEEENALLGPAAYKVTHSCKNGRGVYSFCMCPGGYVVNASSEEGLLCVNGMSYSGRDSAMANSAIIVTVTPKDFPSPSPLAGISFARDLERRAYEAGQGRIPAQYLEDFQKGRPTPAFSGLAPLTKGEAVPADLTKILPPPLTASLAEGMEAFGRKIQGFDQAKTLLLGVESRTSSPVRIPRSPTSLQSPIRGIYPCGEGAGYAGGITSAAMDGLKVAEAIARSDSYVLQ